MCFRGRPRWMWRPLLNSSLLTVQKDPKSSSNLTKHLCRERLVRTAPWKRGWGTGGGREGEEQPGQMQWSDKQMNRQTENGHVRRLGNTRPNTSHCGSQQAAVRVQRCTAKLAASQFSSTAHTMMMMMIRNRFPSINITRQEDRPCHGGGWGWGGGGPTRWSFVAFSFGTLARQQSIPPL